MAKENFFKYIRNSDSMNLNLSNNKCLNLSSGFTLIETLVAMVFMSFILLAVLYAESLAIHQSYQNEANMVAQQVLSYEMSYAHVWANEGNISWTQNEGISCSAANSNSQNCLHIANALNVVGATANQLALFSEPQNMEILLYSQPMGSSLSSCDQSTITGYVFWNFTGGNVSQVMPPSLPWIGGYPKGNFNQYLSSTKIITGKSC
ncbi:MAG: type IV pilus modification PilV family protein [Patescibacteria group bacterium]